MSEEERTKKTQEIMGNCVFIVGSWFLKVIWCHVIWFAVHVSSTNSMDILSFRISLFILCIILLYFAAPSALSDVKELLCSSYVVSHFPTSFCAGVFFLCVSFLFSECFCDRGVLFVFIYLYSQNDKLYAVDVLSW